MKTKILFFLTACSLLAMAAWLAHVPDRAQADDVPEKYRETVHKGLEYLVKNQFKDGHWEGDGGQHPVAMTGLAGLALLMESAVEAADGRRRMLRERKYAAEIRKAVDWLMDRSQAGRDGLIFSEHPSETGRYMEGHGLATLLLAGMFDRRDNSDEMDRARREKLTNVLTRAVKYIVKAQSSQGGWYHTSRVEGHDFAEIATTVIQVQALQAAESAGLPVPHDTVNDAQEYLTRALEKYEGRIKPGQNRGAAIDTAAALAGRHNWNRHRMRPKDEVALCSKRFKYCEAEIPVGRAVQFGRDELAHFYYAQALFFRCNEHGGDEGAWADYRTAMFDYLQSSQNKDGSWPPADGIGVGAVYSTAVWCTVLQLDRSSHPSMQREPEAVK